MVDAYDRLKAYSVSVEETKRRFSEVGGIIEGIFENIRVRHPQITNSSVSDVFRPASTHNNLSLDEMVFLRWGRKLQPTHEELAEIERMKKRQRSTLGLVEDDRGAITHTDYNYILAHIAPENLGTVRLIGDGVEGKVDVPSLLDDPVNALIPALHAALSAPLHLRTETKYAGVTMHTDAEGFYCGPKGQIINAKGRGDIAIGFGNVLTAPRRNNLL